MSEQSPGTSETDNVNVISSHTSNLGTYTISILHTATDGLLYLSLVIQLIESA